MIHHLVLFRFKPETRDVLQPRLASLLDGLPAVIPEIREWDHGANLAVDLDAWDYGLHATFESELAVHAYLDHPAHVAVMDQIAGQIELQFVDFASPAV